MTKKLKYELIEEFVTEQFERVEIVEHVYEEAELDYLNGTGSYEVNYYDGIFYYTDNELNEWFKEWSTDDVKEIKEAINGYEFSYEHKDKLYQISIYKLVELAAK